MDKVQRLIATVQLLFNYLAVQRGMQFRDVCYYMGLSEKTVSRMRDLTLEQVIAGKMMLYPLAYVTQLGLICFRGMPPRDIVRQLQDLERIYREAIVQFPRGETTSEHEAARPKSGALPHFPKELLTRL